MEDFRPRRVPDHHRMLPLGHRFPRGGGGEPPGPRGRAHQRPGEPRLQGPHRRGGLRGRPRRSPAPRCAAGAQVVDVCLQDPDRDEMADVTAFFERASKMVRAPFMIDSTSPAVMERALTLLPGQGDPQLGEPGGRRGAPPEAWCPLARTYGAALVVGTIDEDPAQGMAVTAGAQARRREARLRPAHGEVRRPRRRTSSSTRSSSRAARATRPTAGSAVETLEGLRLIKAEFPEAKTILGISNVSFGLPEAGREVLNSRLPLPRHPGGARPRHREHREASSGTRPSPRRSGASPRTSCSTAAGTRSAPSTPTSRTKRREREGPARPPGTPLERLPRYIVEGTKEGLVEDLEARPARRHGAPRHHQRARSWPGMAEVGRLFNAEPAHRGRGAPVAPRP